MRALWIILISSMTFAQLATGGAPFKSEHVTLDGSKYENRYLGFRFEIPQPCYHPVGIQVIAYPALQPTTSQERSGMLLASNPPLPFEPGACALAVQVDGSSRSIKPTTLLERMLKSAKDVGKTGHMGRSNFQLVRKIEKVKTGAEMWRADYTLDEQLRSGGSGLRYTVLLAGEFRGTTVHWVFSFNDAAKSKDVMNSLNIETESNLSTSGPMRIQVPESVARRQLVYEVEAVAYERLTGRGGEVTLIVVINKDGLPSSIKVKDGHPLLAQGALQAVKQWRFRPYIIHGKAREVETTLRVHVKSP